MVRTAAILSTREGAAPGAELPISAIGLKRRGRCQDPPLRRRFAAPPASCARGEVAAKTGSLTGVSTLAGVTKGKDGRWRSFAIMVNQRPGGYPASATSLAIDSLAAVVQGCA